MSLINQLSIFSLTLKLRKKKSCEIVLNLLCNRLTGTFVLSFAPNTQCFSNVIYIVRAC